LLKEGSGSIQNNNRSISKTLAVKM